VALNYHGVVSSKKRERESYFLLTTLCVNKRPALCIVTNLQQVGIWYNLLYAVYNPLKIVKLGWKWQRWCL